MADRRAQIEVRLAAATPGPWEVIGGGEYISGPDIVVAPDDGGVTSADARPGGRPMSDTPCVDGCGQDAATIERLRAERDASQAEVTDIAHDYDRRGERLWRLAALAGHEPHDADNDATAEMVVRDALAERDALAATVRHMAAEVWDEGFDAGHQAARAVNPEWPALPTNPYRTEETP